MHYRTFALILNLSVCLADAGVRGIPPELESKYVPDSKGNWKCLNNPDVEISFDKINDGYCDCPDGSDEPGTSACLNNFFYCKNEGFKPNFIPSFKIDDGVCDYDVCCDGSDEKFIKCENKCNELKLINDKRIKDFNNNILKGLILKNEILKKSKLLKNEIDDTILSYSNDIQLIEFEKIPSLRKERSKTDKNQEFVINNFKIIENDLVNLNSDVVKSFETLSSNLNNLDDLKSILKKMTENYNHNFNDPAVKQAANDYLNFEAKNDNNLINLDDIVNNLNNLIIKTNDDITKIKNEILNMKFDSTTGTAAATGTDGASNNTFFNRYLSLISDLCERIVRSFLGIQSHSVKIDEEQEEESNIRKRSNIEIDNEINELNNKLNELKRGIKIKENELSKNYGPNDILRSMTDCFSNKIGSYEYKLCPTNILEQINNDGRSTKIGIFQDFKFDELNNKISLIYKNGERCWNGPVREAIVDIECGVKNQILAVTEPEKCSYNIKVTSPIGCFEENVVDME